MEPLTRPMEEKFHRRREWVFLFLAGLFLGTLTMLNILGISYFVDLSFQIFGLQIPMIVAVGVLPYPVTFLCTDLISEFYGKERARHVVWIGVFLNLWVVIVFWVAMALPPADNQSDLFPRIKELAYGAVGASMVAFLAAQFCDVYLYHFWKKKTKGDHLWLRNNGSTLVSQLIDTVAVILITHYYAGTLPVVSEQPLWPQLLTFILSGYFFKMFFALADTIPMYLLTMWLSRYLNIDPRAEYRAAPLEE